MMSNCIPLFWFLFFLINASFCIEGCIESERVAFLEFKNGLTDPSNRLADWAPNSSDCCNWSGIVCHNLTSHVLQLHLRTLSLEEYFGPNELTVVSYNEITEYFDYRWKLTLGGKVSASLLQLKHLSYLDLSNNDFGGSKIPEFIGSIRSLRYLNLSGAGFGGIIPPQLGNLSNLNYLNLLSSVPDYDLHVENLDWVTSLSSLEFLNLDSINLSRSFDWLKAMNSLPLLAELHLSRCSLPGFSPSSTPNLNLSSLVVLDLSYNYFRGPIPNVLQNMSSFLRELDLSSNLFNSSIPNWLYDLTRLQFLDLGDNWLHGQVSSGLRNFTSLVKLDFSYNIALQFDTGILNQFQKFCSLRSLSLSHVKLGQEINHVLENISTCASIVLEYLDLGHCQLSGHLTDDITHFKNLFYFDISYNSILGPIPLSFGNLNKLELVDISNNNLEGEVSNLHFANLTRLVSFDASGMKSKKIALRVSPNWIPPLQLRHLHLESWKIGSTLLEWLRPLKHLRSLDLSNCEISASIPIWFWDSLHKYYYLNFSHNQMHGPISNIPFFNRPMSMIDLSSNNFSGGVPCVSSNISVLDLSHNSFSGFIFDFLCNKMNDKKRMMILNLEGNHLDGEIPNCWGSWRILFALKLNNNSFSGNIPNSIGTLTELGSLHLHNNNLSGEVPFSIKNFTKLFLLDISGNKLVGNISTWIGDSLSRLMILNLRANNFDGNLPKELCHLGSLLILDLSQNNFSGTIPSCFSNFTGMANRVNVGGSLVYSGGSTQFMESVLLLMKGRLMEYNTILGFVRSINLSNNKLSGEIPREITSLAQLESLNLSQNILSGRIPDSIGNMKDLETIDFSLNQLSGEIPPSMTSLTFLSTLNISYNNFTGRIPSGTQLQSFNSSSFIGNHLCGLPLSNNCTSDNVHLDPEMDEDDDNGDQIDIWFYLSTAFGFVFGFWSVLGSLVFIRKWRHFYFHSLYHLKEIIWWNLVGRFH